MDWGSTAENHGGGKAYVLSQKKAQEEMKNRTTGMAKPGKRLFLRQAVQSAAVSPLPPQLTGLLLYVKLT